MKILQYLGVTIALIVNIPLSSGAWGVQGHRVIGGVAEHYLSPQSKKEIQKILGHETLAMASNWADFIRSDKSYAYLAPWHYVNLPENMDARRLNDHLKKDTSANLYTKLVWIEEKLRDRKLPREQQLLYLRLLIHFVGDAHQPMHTGRARDRGGNNIQVYWFNNSTNLHRVWDEHLVDFQQLSYTEHVAAINHITPEQQTTWLKQPISQWILESYQLAAKLYREVKPGARLGYDYNFRNAEVMNRQLLKAGVRLAGLLNSIFENRP